MANICCRIFVMLTIGSIPIHFSWKKEKGSFVAQDDKNEIEQ